MYYMDRELYKMQSGIIAGVSNHISRPQILRENLVTFGDRLLVIYYTSLALLELDASLLPRQCLRHTSH
jgi:hypothetical protein